jgi:hypothetical protein
MEAFRELRMQFPERFLAASHSAPDPLHIDFSPAYYESAAISSSKCATSTIVDTINPRRTRESSPNLGKGFLALDRRMLHY